MAGLPGRTFNGGFGGAPSRLGHAGYGGQHHISAAGFNPRYAGHPNQQGHPGHVFGGAAGHQQVTHAGHPGRAPPRTYTMTDFDLAGRQLLQRIDAQQAQQRARAAPVTKTPSASTASRAAGGSIQAGTGGNQEIVQTPDGPKVLSTYNEYDAVCTHPRTGASVYIGSQRCAQNREMLASINVTRVVNCMEASPNFFEEDPNFGYLNFQVSTWWSAPGVDTASGVLQFFQPCFDFVDRSLEEGRSVLIHCLAGAHRAGTTGVAVVMQRAGMSYADALAHVQEQRAIVNPVANLGEVLEKLSAAFGHQALCTPSQQAPPSEPALWRCVVSEGVGYRYSPSFEDRDVVTHGPQPGEVIQAEIRGDWLKVLGSFGERWVPRVVKGRSIFIDVSKENGKSLPRADTEADTKVLPRTSTKTNSKEFPDEVKPIRQAPGQDQPMNGNGSAAHAKAQYQGQPDRPRTVPRGAAPSRSSQPSVESAVASAVAAAQRPQQQAQKNESNEVSRPVYYNFPTGQSGSYVPPVGGARYAMPERTPSYVPPPPMGQSSSYVPPPHNAPQYVVPGQRVPSYVPPVAARPQSSSYVPPTQQQQAQHQQRQQAHHHQPGQPQQSSQQQYQAQQQSQSQQPQQQSQQQSQQRMHPFAHTYHGQGLSQQIKHGSVVAAQFGGPSGYGGGHVYAAPGYSQRG
eukprot:CAMPEP_0204355854 /NCGR_PEP_ID=MMETSP0469-20131031/34479_1 /ASSEMBLY_ACC=CAM_ASM_000384 /TAXON_ID=2969 /ORGANISM="Oxyrrhis marina" /LENGTH=682 /DNA_ID=CAMNT_0051343197 /DNA_START=21 /DNA_END=2069 /DNA_ORIENTATION=+